MEPVFPGIENMRECVAKRATKVLSGPKQSRLTHNSYTTQRRTVMADEPNAPSDQVPPSSFDWKAFSQKTWVIVIGGILIPPVGMILAWLKPGWTNRTKWIATGLLGLLLIGRMQSKPEMPSGDASAEAESRSVETVVETPSLQTDRELPSSIPAEKSPSSQSRRSDAGPIADGYYKVGWTEGKRQAENFFTKQIKGKETTPHLWTPSLMERVTELKRVMDIHAGSTIKNSEDHSRGEYKGFMSVAKPWVEIAEANTRNSEVAEKKQSSQSKAKTPTKPEDPYKAGWKQGRSLAETMVTAIQKGGEYKNHMLPQLIRQAEALHKGVEMYQQVNKRSGVKDSHNSKNLQGQYEGFMSVAAPYVP
jgi:hypothetical protein